MDERGWGGATFSFHTLSRKRGSNEGKWKQGAKRRRFGVSNKKLETYLLAPPRFMRKIVPFAR